MKNMDITANGFNGFHTTTIAGQEDPKYDDIQSVAESLGLNKNKTRDIYEMIEAKCRNFTSNREF